MTIDRGMDFDWSAIESINDAINLLKLYLQELPDPLFTHKLLQEWNSTKRKQNTTSTTLVLTTRCRYQRRRSEVGTLQRVDTTAAPIAPAVVAARAATVARGCSSSRNNEDECQGLGYCHDT